MAVVWQTIKNFRKAFLTRFIKIHYAQFGEDIILKNILGRQKKGFYVDVGCYHPKKKSNTYSLYKRGWRGINIDMEQHKVALFALARKGDINIVAAVSDREETFYLQSDKPYDLFAVLSKSKTPGERVRTQTLTALLNATPYKNQRIDLLTIDAEGYDYPILRSLDFTIYRPKVLVVESHDTDIMVILRSPMHQFISEKGYRLRSWTLFSLIYIES